MRNFNQSQQLSICAKQQINIPGLFAIWGQLAILRKAGSLSHDFSLSFDEFYIPIDMSLNIAFSVQQLKIFLLLSIWAKKTT